jgi:hypothetical protein
LALVLSAWTGKRCVGCDGKKGPKYAAKKFCGHCTIKVRKANREAAHAARILKVYGITREQYDALYALQGGCCALCQRATGVSKKLAVDHDHATGKVRGLLCGTCNKIVGHARDDEMFFKRGYWYLIETPFDRLQEGESDLSYVGLPEPPDDRHDRWLRMLDSFGSREKVSITHR